mgnify:CR=1 FL=1
MRKEQCKFCTSRRCYERIVTPDMSFDEVACRRHTHDLALHANKVLNGAIRWNISSTGTMKRSEPFDDAEQGLHPTSGILPDLQALSTPQPLATSQALSTPPTCG